MQEEYMGYLPDSPEDAEHYGTKRHSGRYPYGSGDEPFQHEASFMNHIYDLRNKGMSDVDIARSMDMSTTEYRARITKATQYIKSYQVAEAIRLKNKGYSNIAIGKRMGMNESSVRSLLSEDTQKRRGSLQKNVDFLKEQVEKHGMVDVGSGVEEYMGITADAKRKAVKNLEQEGYSVVQLRVTQMGTGKDTTVKVLAKPGTDWSYVKKHRDQIVLPDPCYSEDGGKTVKKIRPPVSIDSKRIFVRYVEDGGKEKDGTIELRPGVPDLDLGAASYAQVRIAVDGTHYIKGVAYRSPDEKAFPPGCDIIVNSNKKKGTPLTDPDPDVKQVLKPMKKDKENPFGATIQFPDELKRCQADYIDADGNKKQSALNIVSEEGTWAEWGRHLPSQFLGKQSPVLAKKQLKLQHDILSDEFKTIMELDNPAVKKQLLNEFAGKCTSAATHMEAAAFPRQSTRLLLPCGKLKDNEIYCPGLNTGDHVILVRYPHAGVFEIPYLVVNNNIKEARATIGDAIDACMISSKAAQQLSGADYDGDTATCIPVDNLNGIKVARMKDELQKFDPDAEFPPVPGSHRMTKRDRQMEMGSVSNLITDMTIKGASEEEIIRAVKHSMVVVDAYKHHYNYKLSEEVFGIKDLKRKYQGGPNAGASTLLSRATGDIHIPLRKEKLYSKMTDEEKERWRNGETIYVDTGYTFSKKKTDKDGNPVYSKELRKESISKMQYTFDQGLDAYSLVSGTPETATRIERVYADYANSVMDIRKQALAAARALPDISYSPEARKQYRAEVDELLQALSVAHRNAPLERAAQIFANKEYSTKIANSPELAGDDEKKKKLKSEILKRARYKFGAKKTSVYISDRQWEAINAGAVSNSVLNDILSNADKDRVKYLAMPKTNSGVSAAQVARARALFKNGYTQEDVANMLGVSVNTLMRAVNN